VNVVNIVNSAGKIVYQGTWLKEDNKRDFDVSDLDPGIYVIDYTKPGDIIYQKIHKAIMNS
jgi:hypothetical protein